MVVISKAYYNKITAPSTAKRLAIVSPAMVAPRIDYTAKSIAGDYSKSRFNAEEEARKALAASQQRLAEQSAALNQFSVDDNADVAKKSLFAEEAAKSSKQVTADFATLKTYVIPKKYADIKRGTTPIETWNANIDAGRLQQDTSKARAAALSDPTPENTKLADTLGKTYDAYVTKNRDAFYYTDANGVEKARGNVITRVFANYVPQLVDQIVANIPAIALSIGAGLLTGGAYTAAEIAAMTTTQLAARAAAIGLTSNVAGAGASAIAGWNQSYDVTRGAAYDNLISLGVPADRAKEISANEAFWSSLIEMSDNVLDWSLLGFGKVAGAITQLGTGVAADIVAKTGKEVVVKSAMRKMVDVLAKYGVNILSEGSQEWVQEGLSIRGEKAGLGSARTATAQEDLQRQNAAFQGGAQIAAITGGASLAGTTIATNMINRVNQDTTTTPTSKPTTPAIAPVANTGNNAAVTTPVTTLPLANTITPKAVETTSEVQIEGVKPSVKVKSFGVTEERLNSTIKDYGSPTNQNYSKAYMVKISPDEFLSLTATDASIIEQDAKPFNAEQLSKVKQDIFIRYNPDTLEVTSHEGRNRIASLKQAGVDNVSVILIPDGEKGKYNRQNISSLNLSGQEFSDGRKATGKVTLKDLIPINESHRQELVEKFSAENIAPAPIISPAVLEKISIAKTETIKTKQLEIIKANAPALDDIHTGIRTIEDIKTFTEAKALETFTPDYTKEMADQAEKSGTVTVYSSKPIKEGVFVTPSKQIAQSEVGTGQVYSEEVPIDDVAWTGTVEGRYIPMMNLQMFADKANKFAKTVLDEQGSDMQQQTLVDGLSEVYEAVYEARKDKADITTKEYAETLADSLAKEILGRTRNSLVTENESAKEIRSYLKRVYIIPTHIAQEDLATYKQNFKRIKFASDAMTEKGGANVLGLDVVYNELANSYPNLFDRTQQDPVGMLRDIVKASNEITATTGKYLLDQAEINEYAPELAKSLLDSYDEVGMLDSEKYIKKLRDRITELRKNKNDKIERMKKGFSEKLKTTKKQATLNKATAISKALKKRTEQNIASRKEARVKIAERKAINKQVKELQNLDTKYMLPKYQRNIEAILSPFDLTAKKHTAKKLFALQELKNFMEENPDNNIPDYKLKELEMLSKKTVSQITKEEFDSIYTAVMHLVHLGKLKDQLIMQGKYRSATEAATEAATNVTSGRTVKTDPLMVDTSKPEYSKGLLSGAKEFFLNHFTPETFVLMSDQKSDGIIKKIVFDNMYAGYSNVLDFKQQADKIFSPFLKSLGGDLRNWSRSINKNIKSNELVEIPISKQANQTIQKIRVTKAERIYLYLGSFDTDIRRSMLKGGISFKNNLSQIIHLTESDVDTINGSLTADEKKFSDLANQYFKWAGVKINEVFLKLNGYELIQSDKNYLPKESHPDMIQRDFLKMKNKSINASIEGMGFLKERTKTSKAVVVDDIFRVIIGHMEEASAYYGYAEPLRNAKMLLGNPDLKNAYRRVGMNNVLTQLNNYISDIEKKSIDMDFVEKLGYSIQNKFSTAALGANPFTIMKQPSSYILEANEIPVQYLLKAIATKSEFDEIRKYSPILTDRIDGNVSMEMGDIGKVARVRELFGNYKDIPQALTKGISAADRMIVGKTWNAVKMMLKAENPNITQEELMTKTARKVEEVIRHTNSAATMHDRSSIGRSRSLFTRAITIFTSQTNVMLNSATQAMLELNNSNHTTKDFATATKKLVTIYLLANLFEQSIDQFRRKVKGQDDKPWNIPMDIIGGMLDQIYFVGKAFKVYQSKVEYGKYFGYDFSIPQMQLVEQLLNYATDITTMVEQKATQEVYKSGDKKGSLKWQETLKSITNETFSILAKLNGLPYDSVKGLIDSQINKQ